MSHTDTGIIIKGDLQQLKASADSQGLCPWFQEEKQGTEKEREIHTHRNSKQEKEDGQAKWRVGTELAIPKD